MIYLLSAMTIVAALLGAFGAWEHKGKLAAEAQVGELTAKIEAQNQAIAATKAEGDRRVKQAQDGIKAARSATLAAQAEGDRLRGLASAEKPTPLGSCPEKDAVAEIRAGLKP